MKIKEKQTIVRFQPNEDEGLSQLQVESRNRQKLVNNSKFKTSKSFLSIICTNVFTFFNLIWAIIFVALVWIGAVNDLLFIIVIILNTFISIVQEIRAKITVEKLSIVTMPRLVVIREDKKEQIFASKLVLDDIIVLETGNQIPTDCILISGNVEINESLLTGESKPIKKQIGDTLLGGGFIVSGVCKAKVDKVGKDSWVQNIACEAKKFKSPSSNLTKNLSTIIKYIGIIIVPIGILMYFNNKNAYAGDMFETVRKTCGALTGMVPAGMFLLITVALALGIIKLAKKKALVQNLFGIEMLARTDVLCLDKTGTLTDGTMQVCDVELLDKAQPLSQIMGNLLDAQLHQNATGRALIEYFGKDGTLTINQNLQFSSSRKFMATQFDKQGTYALGAYGFACNSQEDEIKSKVSALSKMGKRVLVLTHSNSSIVNDSLPPDMQVIAIIGVMDHIREDAIETIDWFKNNGVTIKIISGDDPQTVSQIANRVGVENANQCVNLEGLSLSQVAELADKFTVFGRVSPEQKHKLIKTLKIKGHIVAMTGDGVNDTLALKESDCSIAMADGSEVARNISNIVLMDSKFSSLPAIVKEGRQVINNVEKSSTLFLMKTICTILLSIISLATLTAYPFGPSNMLLLEMFVIGIPSVVFALQPNNNKIEGNFIKNVFKKAIPYAILLVLNIIIVMACKRANKITFDEMGVAATIALVNAGFLNLIMLSIPFSKLTIAMLVTSFLLICVTPTLVPEMFGVPFINGNIVLLCGLLLIMSVPLSILIHKFGAKLVFHSKNKKNKKN
ncbi:MAG: HAD-IC family P-type ATPase [Clostridia bacterium]